MNVRPCRGAVHDGCAFGCYRVVLGGTNIRFIKAPAPNLEREGRAGRLSRSRVLLLNPQSFKAYELGSG